MIKYLRNIKTYIQNRSYNQDISTSHLTVDDIPLFKYLSFKNVLEIDRFLFIMVFFLMGIGLVQIYSASYIYATDTYNDGLFFFQKQFLFVVIGLCLMLFIALLSKDWILPIGITIFAISLFLLILTLIPQIGVKVGGASRWISLPFGFRLEPSEFFKVSLPFVVGPLIVKSWDRISYMSRVFLVILGLLPVFIFIKQPDFGALVIYYLVLFSLMFLRGVKWSTLLLTGFLSFSSLFVFMLTSPYRLERFKSFLDPWSRLSSSGFQTIQSLLGFHTGGLMGIGLGNGQSKLYFLPEAHTDFTLSVLGEEAGFIGVSLVLLLFGIILFRLFHLSKSIWEEKLRYVFLGLTLTFGIQTFINFSVSLGMLPTKGLTLPFLSYGGSSLISMSLLFGFALAIQRVCFDKT